MAKLPSPKNKTSPLAGEYCLAILALTQATEKPLISARLASYFKVAPPTVSLTLKRLKRAGLISLDQADKTIRLTEQGKELALSLRHRQYLMARFLNEALGLSKAEALEEAQHLKHSVSPTVERALSDYLNSAMFSLAQAS